MQILVLITVLSLVAGVIDVVAFSGGILAAIACMVLSFLTLNVLFLIVEIIIGETVDITKPIETQKPIYRYMAYAFASIVNYYSGARVKVENEALIPTDGRFLFVSNHISAFDALSAISALYKHNISFICKPSLMQYPITKTIGHGAGYLPIDRENDRNALKTILTAADYAKRDLCSIGIYPEGTRSKSENGEMLSFHAGSLKIAQKANIPIVVASTIGTDKISKNFPFKTTKVKIRILEVIPAEKVKASPTAELAAYTHDLIQADVYAQQNR